MARLNKRKTLKFKRGLVIDGRTIMFAERLPLTSNSVALRNEILPRVGKQKPAN